MNSRPSPIVLFVFNRPEETREALKALARNHGAAESDLTIFCDGPRKPEDVEKIERVRAIAGDTTGFKNVRVITRSRNQGSVDSIRAGVTQMLDEFDSVIVLEDDLITSQYFLKFMNEALYYYATEDRVVSICGYTPSYLNVMTETFFLPGAHCWGWGTWRRSWNLAEMDAGKLLDDIVRQDLIFEMDYCGAEPCTQLLQKASTGRGDSWILPWMAAAIVNKQLTLYPQHSLVSNEGLLASGLSEKWLHLFEATVTERSPQVGTIALEADVDALALGRSLFMQWRSADSLKRMVYNRLMRLFPVGVDRLLYSAIVRRSLHRETRD